MVALKWSDIDWQAQKIHIQRTEGKAKNKDYELRPMIHEYTKKNSPHGNRYLPLSDYETSLFQRVNDINLRFSYSDDDFVFCDENGRTKIREIDNCIRTQCTCANIPEKSAHDIRRTVV